MEEAHFSKVPKTTHLFMVKGKVYRYLNHQQDQIGHMKLLTFQRLPQYDTCSG
jgi:hypothetical protein